MSKYKFPRAFAFIVSGLGWLLAAVALFFAVFRFIRTDAVSYATSLPFLVLAFLGLALVLFGWIARAVFDIADRASWHAGLPVRSSRTRFATPTTWHQSDKRSVGKQCH